MNKEERILKYINTADELVFSGIRYYENDFYDDVENLVKENQELKKQLEEIYKFKFSYRKDETKIPPIIRKQKDVEIIKNLENQQKEFIEYLEKEKERCLTFYSNTPCMYAYDVFKEILSKYKEITGVPMAGLDDEEEPDLFEMIEDIKNKPKYIEEINKSYPIFNFDEKSFEAMKDMLQDVYSKQVEIIKSVNYLFDKDERQHRKNNE